MSSKPACNGQGGKDDWDRVTDRKRFERNYITSLGATCPKCGGIGCHYCTKGKIYDADYYYRLGGA